MRKHLVIEKLFAWIWLTQWAYVPAKKKNSDCLFIIISTEFLWRQLKIIRCFIALYYIPEQNLRLGELKE